MGSKILAKESSIYKVNLFYMCVVIWSIIFQFLPIPMKAYQYITFLIPISIYLFIHKNQGDRILKPKILNVKSTIIIFIIWVFSLPIMVTMADLYTSFFGDKLANIIMENHYEGFIENLVFTAITPALLEEILMRGIILDGYRNKSFFVAALINGIMFGMLHLNFFQFFYTFIAGFIASYLVFATNSLYAAMIFHFINNGFPTILNYIYPSEPDTAYAVSPSLLNSLIQVMLSVIALSLFIHLLAKINGINLIKHKQKSNEKIFNWPLITSIILFILFSIFLVILLSIKEKTPI
ncbi:CPBP family intramembrane glutamic endopeptidase [Tepidimicrobium xylanilyticum]|uniref:CPBP family intramembrane glutamic endopeptidase n=1 Tax=Tepidimicrobium xylanilyticum TaxID=1123352 RepID=UPI00264D8413|nr:type II CAAX endopeptidase family protein [Tepidimicrobium xylanilyticum]GMG97426.1 hypothetical protein EN5CB1_22520 [Tepidimicrobium xylanilyticum]